MILLIIDIKNFKLKDNNIPINFKKNRYSAFEYQIIKDVLNDFYNITDFKIKYTINGKPYLNLNNIFLSISHDNDLLAICFDNKNIGIDLQFYNSEAIKIKSFLNMDTSNSREIIDIFSKKEAILKLEGKNLKDINTIDISQYDIRSFSNNKYTLNIAYYNCDTLL